MNETSLILGIESSCDETAAAIVRAGSHPLSNVVASQMSLHANYGGVVPELASREHLRNIVPVVREALQRANDIRVRRAKLKKDLKEGRVKIEAILNSPPEYVSTAKVFDILMAVPKFGRVKAARFLNQCRISQSKTVGGLSERQRAELVGLFARH